MPSFKKPQTAEEIQKVAQEYESMVFGNFLKGFFVGLEDSSVFGDGHSAEIIKGWFIDAIVKNCPNTGLGLANQIADKMIRNMENTKTGENYDTTI